MKKIVVAIICILSVSAYGVPSTNIKSDKQNVIVKKVAGEKLIPITRQLEIGSIQIYDFGKIKLHVYNTNDAINDICYLLETDKELIAIEAPPFFNNIKEYTRYVELLEKPLNNILIPYHPTGLESFNDADFIGTQSSKASLEEGGSINGLIKNFNKIFGDSFDTAIPEITKLIKTGNITIGGLKFVVTETKNGFDLEIPAINSVFTHMLGSDVHNILGSITQIDGMIAELNIYKTKGYNLILTSHYVPETLKVVDKKIDYLEKTKETIKKSSNKEEFLRTMKENFPSYLGENYLNMSAQILFSE